MIAQRVALNSGFVFTNNKKKLGMIWSRGKGRRTVKTF